MLSEKAITNFIAIWKKEYGELLDRHVAAEKAEQFLGGFSLVYQPIKHGWKNELKSNDHGHTT